MVGCKRFDFFVAEGIRKFSELSLPPALCPGVPSSCAHWAHWETRALYHLSCFIYVKSVILFIVSMWGDHVDPLLSHPVNTVRSGEEPCQGRDKRRAGVWGGWALHTALYVTVWDGRQTKCSICATSLKTSRFLCLLAPPPPRPSENPNI